MFYIAIKENSFVMIDENSNANDLQAQGFTLMTLEQYQTYVQEKSTMTLEQTLSMLEAKSEEYIDFGVKLWEVMKRKTWAINTYNKSQGNDLGVEGMKTLLATSDLLEKSLRSGSLLTAKDISIMLKNQLPQYTSVSDFVCMEIDHFLGL